MAAASCSPTRMLVASGTFGYGTEYSEVVDVQRLGAICSKGTTLRPRDRQSAAARDRDAGGHAQLDRPAEPGRRRGARQVLDDVVALGRAGHRQRRGRVDRGLRRGLPATRRRSPASRASSSTSRAPTSAPAACQFALDPGAAGELTAAVREATDLPLMVKLSPAATDIRTIAKRIAEGGADAISGVQHAARHGHRPHAPQGAARATSTAG